MHRSLFHEVIRYRALEGCQACPVHFGAEVMHLCRVIDVEHHAVALFLLLLVLGEGRAAHPLRVDLVAAVAQDVHGEL